MNYINAIGSIQQINISNNSVIAGFIYICPSQAKATITNIFKQAFVLIGWKHYW